MERLKDQKSAQLEAKKVLEEERRLEIMDQKILPIELKELHPKKSKVTVIQYLKRFLSKGKTKRKLNYKIRPIAVASYDPRDGSVESSPINYEVYNKLTRSTGEVIEPQLGDTAETIASYVSAAAVDHAYPRIIVYPIVGPVRREVVQLIMDNPRLYPLFEYREANITNDDSLNSRTLIFKYGGQTHYSKPV
jgi:hypothetical protein